MPFGVCAYGFPVGCGFAQRGEPLSNPLKATEFMALATAHGLSSIEIPLTGMLPDLEPATIDRFRAAREQANLGLVVDTGVVDIETLERMLPLAARAGAHVVRATLSTILEGARADLPGGWAAHLAEMQRRITALLPVLATHDLVLALENHQDATSDDLLALCEAGDGHVGITLDVANPLAVAEEPLEFAHKIGPWIRNVHLKDYQVWATPSGYRLVRCALGDGVVPFPELITLLTTVAPAAPMHIELAALYARHIRVWEDHWWDGFGPRDVRAVIPAIRSLAQQARLGDDWPTPMEREAPAAEVAAYEREQFEQSVRYLRDLGV